MRQQQFTHGVSQDSVKVQILQMHSKNIEDSISMLHAWMASVTASNLNSSLWLWLFFVKFGQFTVICLHKSLPLSILLQIKQATALWLLWSIFSSPWLHQCLLMSQPRMRTMLSLNVLASFPIPNAWITFLIISKWAFLRTELSQACQLLNKPTLLWKGANSSTEKDSSINRYSFEQFQKLPSKPHLIQYD